MSKFSCPWCWHEWDTDRVSDYESCPRCHGSFSFGQPRPVLPGKPREHTTIATRFPFLTIVVDSSVPEDVIEFRQKGAVIGRFKIPEQS